ncbi:hypothetical protein TYRP_009800 [Tyrophagus putrescentiae]|nr:hypothetical protein TYRP_009800 [Tyrophagus putrescentiae]
MLSLTGSFKDGKTIADAIGICEKQFKATPTNDLDFDENVLRKVTEANTEKIEQTRPTTLKSLPF